MRPIGASSPRVPRHHLSRRQRAAALGAVATGLVPWTVMLWRQLPSHGHSRAYRNAWVALDGAEATAFALAAYWHLRRDPRQLPLLRLASVLLVADGIADLTLARTPREQGAALLMLPIEWGGAAWCHRVAYFARYELAGYDTEKHR